MNRRTTLLQLSKLELVDMILQTHTDARKIEMITKALNAQGTNAVSKAVELNKRVRKLSLENQQLRTMLKQNHCDR